MPFKRSPNGATAPRRKDGKCRLKSRKPAGKSQPPTCAVDTKSLLPAHHFLGMTARLFGDGHAAEHARQFADAIAFVQMAHPGKSPSLLDFFLNDEMGVGQGGYLRQVGHTDHLMMRGYQFQLFADDFRHPGAPS